MHGARPQKVRILGNGLCGKFRGDSDNPSLELVWWKGPWVTTRGAKLLTPTVAKPLRWWSHEVV